MGRRDDVVEIERKDRSIMVDVQNLQARLLSCVPAYGGSKYTYCDEAKISGILVACRTGGFKFSITNVNSFVVYKHGNPFAVDF